MKKYIFLIVFPLLLVHCKAQKTKLPIATNSDENTVLWKVSGKGIKPTYLLGTMHLLCTEDAILSKNLENVLQNVDEIYMELDMDNMSDMLGAVGKMNMNNGVKLKDLLTDAEYQKVKTYFSKKNSVLPFEMMENFKPMLIASTLSEEEMPCKNGVSGIEMKIMEMNKTKWKKNISGLETIAMQLAVFDSIPYAEQAKMLLQYVDSLPNTIKETDKLTEAYLSQNLKNIETLVSKSEPGLEKYMDLLLINRNKNWVKQLTTICKTKSIIAAVGAGHLVGKDGLLALLKKAGYTVTPLKNK